MPDRANLISLHTMSPQAMSLDRGRAGAGRGDAAGVPRASSLGRWAGLLAAGSLVLSLAACGGPSVQAGPTGGVMKSGDAMGAQEAALKHCRKYGKSGRITGPLGDDTYSFVCE